MDLIGEDDLLEEVKIGLRSRTLHGERAGDKVAHRMSFARLMSEWGACAEAVTQIISPTHQWPASHLSAFFGMRGRTIFAAFFASTTFFASTLPPSEEICTCTERESSELPCAVISHSPMRVVFFNRLLL